MTLQATLQEHSVLQFTIEQSAESRILFLDIDIDASTEQYVTSVFRKPTGMGNCLNGLSECSDEYKESVIRAYIHRAITLCSSWQLIHQEFQRVRQVLVNTRYRLTDIDNQIRIQLHKHFTKPVLHKHLTMKRVEK